MSGQIPVPNGYVNTTNGNLHLEFPLASFPQRGKAPLKFTLSYDSNFWYELGNGNYGTTYGNINSLVNSNLVPEPTVGWTIASTSDSGSTVAQLIVDGTCNRDGMDDADIYSTWTYTSNDGVSHQFPIKTEQGFVNACGDWTSENQPTGDALALDGSGYHMYVTNYNGAAVYAPDGTTFISNGSPGVRFWVDPNGNFFNDTASDPTWLQTVTTPGNTSTAFTDTVGRSPVTITQNGWASTFAFLDAGVNGGKSNYIITFELINYHTNFGLSSCCEVSGSIIVVKSIQLPDGTSYSFSYDSGTTWGHYGQLTSMTLPTGATIQYAYTNFLDSEFTPGYTAHVTRMLNTMTTPDGQYTFTGSVITQCTGTVQPPCEQQLTYTKPSGDNVVYKSRIQAGMWPIEADYYNGSVSPSHLLASVTQGFDFSHPCAWYNWPYYLCGRGPQDVQQVTKLSETVTLPVSTSSNINQTTQFCYDINYGNLLSQWEWKFYTGAVIHDPNPPSSCSLYSGVPTPDRTTTYTYLNGSSYLAKTIYNRPASMTVTDSGGGTVSRTTYSYDGSTLLSGAVGTCPAVTGSANHDDTNFGTGNTVRGNLTQVQQLIGGSNYLTTSKTYDITGQVRTSTDARGSVTTYCYGDNFFTDAGNSSNPTGYTSSTPTNAYLTTITHPTVNSVTLTEKLGYYWGTGQQALSTDANNQTTYHHFYDPLNRPTSTILPSTAMGTGWTYNVYNSTDTQVDSGIGITSSTPATTCTGSVGDCRHDQLTVDGMGRTTTSTLVSDPDGPTMVATSYDSNGRVYSTSSPYRTTSDTTYGLTIFSYDGLDRHVQVTHADGSTSYNYFGPAVSANGGLPSQQCSGNGVGYPSLSKDEAGKLHQAWIDGFGRLIEVDEPNPSGSLSSGYNTCYTYNLAGNITGVTQGSESRSFAYDLLSRQTSATNPESGTTNYYYTTTISGTTACSGEPNLPCLRVEPQANQTNASVITTTTYTYDALDRLTSTSYNDPTPTTSTVQQGYDGVALTGCTTTPPSLTITNGLGRRTSMCDGSGAASWSYDSVGNNLAEKQALNAVTNTIQYGFNLDSTLATIQYPTGRTITYAPGGAERPLSAKDITNNVNYGTAVHYAAPGELSALTDGGTVNFTAIYDKRLNPCWHYATTGTALPWNTTACNGSATAGSVIDIKYAYNAGTADNGNVAAITNNRDSTRSQTFSYDGLNRLSTAGSVGTSGTNCWDEQYSFDRYGNLSGGSAISGGTYNSGCNGERWSMAVNSQNQLNTVNSPYFVYDAAGNLTTVPSPASAAYSYDGENRLRKAVTSSTFGYVYDGDGRRVEKTTSGSVTKLYWYDRAGHVLDETDGNGNLTNEFVFLGGKHISRRDSANNYYYYFSDQISSSRVITNASGAICFDADYYPFGPEITEFTSTCPQNYKFTGKERDGSLSSETGLDYFGARQYSSQYGRFTSADPANLGVDFWLPQTWNRYAYVQDNPLGNTDGNGMWPTNIHEQIIDETFKGILTSDQIQTLKKASYDTDYVNTVNGAGPQDAAASFVHGMSDPNTDPTGFLSQVQGDAFIAKNEQEAQDLQAIWIATGHTGISPAALKAFGNALHTITDRTSPMHAGNQPWHGIHGPTTALMALSHVFGERKISPFQRQNAETAALNGFYATFYGTPPPRENVTHRIIYDATVPPPPQLHSPTDCGDRDSGRSVCNMGRDPNM